MRKAADMQEEIMEKGLHTEAVPKSYNVPAPVQQSEDSSMSGQLPGYGQVMLEGQM